MQNIIPVGINEFTSAPFVVPPSHKATVLLTNNPSPFSQVRLEQQQADGTSYSPVAIMSGGVESARYTIDTPGVYRLFRFATAMAPIGVDVEIGSDEADATFPDKQPAQTTRSALYGWDGSVFQRLLSFANRLTVRIDGEAFVAAQTFSLTVDNTWTTLGTYTADYVDLANTTDKNIEYKRSGSSTGAYLPPGATRRVVLPSHQLSSISVRNAEDNDSITISGDAVRRVI